MHFRCDGALVGARADRMPRMESRKTTLRCRRGLVWTCVLGFALFSGAAEAQGVFSVNQPWVKPGARSSEAYMVLSSSAAATLVGVHCDRATKAIIRGRHGGTATRLELPAGRSVSLRPGAGRIALSGLTQALRPGDRVLLVLTIETANGARRDIAVNAEVRNESPVDAELRMHRH